MLEIKCCIAKSAVSNSHFIYKKGTSRHFPENICRATQKWLIIFCDVDFFRTKFVYALATLCHI